MTTETLENQYRDAQIVHADMFQLWGKGHPLVKDAREAKERLYKALCDVGRPPHG